MVVISMLVAFVASMIFSDGSLVAAVPITLGVGMLCAACRADGWREGIKSAETEARERAPLNK